jgi:hypothetical protein
VGACAPQIKNTKSKTQNQKTEAIQTGWLFYLEEKVTREEVLTTIREVAERLGHPPTFIELETMTPLRRRAIRKHFGSYTWALRESSRSGDLVIGKSGDRTGQAKPNREKSKGLPRMNTDKH